MDVCKTPPRAIPKHLRPKVGSFTTPLKIPATPQLKKLGYGTGVEVLRVERSKMGAVRSPWAIKRLNKKCDKTYAKLYNKRLIDEASILRKLEHPNIVGFRNILNDKCGNTILAMEDGHKSLGDLLETRFEGDLGPLEAEKITRVCVDVAHALHYLHFTVSYMHGDLKSYNVLVKGDFDVCKLCDFGVSQPLDKDGFIDIKNYPDARYVGTDLWSAPEVFSEDMEIVGTKSEMFSYGLVIYEMLALTAPHIGGLMDEPEPVDDSVISVKDSDDEGESELEKSITPLLGTRPPLPDYLFGPEYNNILGLFFICTNQEPDERPSAKECIIYFDSCKSE
ncbi:lymphokine-activated killer T-cell-originated protein kinase [Culicoides brevitarsis]|uniref:lymphokine-activated killer T-cell-originated protein kinase n=1 Tax=Culicoides brevitarsis TaxID=469753 RepID=UPI00307CB85E